MAENLSHLFMIFLPVIYVKIVVLFEAKLLKIYGCG